MKLTVMVADNGTRLLPTHGVDLALQSGFFGLDFVQRLEKGV